MVTQTTHRSLRKGPSSEPPHLHLRQAMNEASPSHFCLYARGHARMNIPIGIIERQSLHLQSQTLTTIRRCWTLGSSRPTISTAQQYKTQSTGEATNDCMMTCTEWSRGLAVHTCCGAIDCHCSVQHGTDFELIAPLGLRTTFINGRCTSTNRSRKDYERSTSTPHELWR